MAPGDLVVTRRSGVGVYADWLDYNTKFTTICEGVVGLMLDSYLPAGGNGCKVLFPDGAVGWCGAYEIEVVR